MFAEPDDVQRGPLKNVAHNQRLFMSDAFAHTENNLLGLGTWVEDAGCMTCFVCRTLTDDTNFCTTQLFVTYSFGVY